MNPKKRMTNRRAWTIRDEAVEAIMEEAPGLNSDGNMDTPPPPPPPPERSRAGEAPRRFQDHPVPDLSKPPPPLPSAPPLPLPVPSKMEETTTAAPPPSPTRGAVAAQGMMDDWFPVVAFNKDSAQKVKYFFECH